jgi:hypothetical protein
MHLFIQQKLTVKHKIVASYKKTDGVHTRIYIHVYGETIKLYKQNKYDIFIYRW